MEYISFTNMLKTLPFAALRTLESVVRLKGFGRAAEELNVTQSAVSQHIRSLEEWLGQKLLIRGPRQTLPTDVGQRLTAAVTAGFGTVEKACDELRSTNNKYHKGLLVACPPGFAFTWLLPRLLKFDEIHHDMPISLSTDVLSQEAKNSSADVVIHYGTGRLAGMHAEQLMTETMAPICAPEIAKQINRVEDLANFTLLEDLQINTDFEPTWDYWSRQTGNPLPNIKRRRRFAQANMVVQAATEGLGIAMGRSALVSDALEKGALVHPFDAFATSQLSYWFACTEDALNSRSVQAFRTWLFDEAAQNTAT